MKPRYMIRYGYDTAPTRQYEKNLKFKIRYGCDTSIKKLNLNYILKLKIQNMD